MKKQTNNTLEKLAHSGPFLRLRGGELPLSPMPSYKSIFLAWLGGVIAISAVMWLTVATAKPLVLGSLGASCVLVFGYPDVPFSQPRNIVLGHTLSTFIGLVFLTIFGAHWWAAGLAAGTAIAVMMITRTVHPPAGSNPVIVFLSQPSWSFLLYPTLVGALIVTIVATIYNNATKSSNYPKYW